jgi:hypothetical protein
VKMDLSPSNIFPSAMQPLTLVSGRCWGGLQRDVFLPGSEALACGHSPRSAAPTDGSFPVSAIWWHDPALPARSSSQSRTHGLFFGVRCQPWILCIKLAFKLLCVFSLLFGP